MFRCQLCLEVVPPRIGQTKVVVAKRAIEHPRRTESRWKSVEGRMREVIEVIDWGGQGTAIVREVSVCPDCARRRA